MNHLDQPLQDFASENVTQLFTIVKGKTVSPDKLDKCVIEIILRQKNAEYKYLTY